MRLEEVFSLSLSAWLRKKARTVLLALENQPEKGMVIQGGLEICTFFNRWFTRVRASSSENLTGQANSGCSLCASTVTAHLFSRTLSR